MIKKARSQSKKNFPLTNQNFYNYFFENIDNL